MRNGLRSTATAVALIAGVIAASAQTGPGVQAPAQKQDEQPKQKARSQQPAPAQVQQRREPQSVQPRQGATPQRGNQGVGAGNRAEPRNQAIERRGPAARQPLQQEQTAKPSQRREQNVERRQPREQASNRGSFNPEQRTRMRAGFERHRVAPANGDFTISVGRNVPDYVRTYAVPEDVWSIWPEYRRYVYIWVGDEILVINPRTHRIVAILQA